MSKDNKKAHQIIIKHSITAMRIKTFKKKITTKMIG